MTYAVKECFLTLQGEGMQTGRRAVFLRFAGCNLWSGREEDRETAKCTFCDTDFVGMDGPGGGRGGGPSCARLGAGAEGPGLRPRLPEGGPHAVDEEDLAYLAHRGGR